MFKTSDEPDIRSGPENTGHVRPDRDPGPVRSGKKNTGILPDITCYECIMTPQNLCINLKAKSSLLFAFYVTVNPLICYHLFVITIC